MKYSGANTVQKMIGFHFARKISTALSLVVVSRYGELVLKFEHHISQIRKYQDLIKRSF